MLYTTWGFGFAKKYARSASVVCAQVRVLCAHIVCVCVLCEIHYSLE